MMWKEFEELAGYEVSFEDYTNVIEPMYMATNMSKADFVKCIDKKRFALKTKRQLINEMKKKAAEIAEIVEHNGAYPQKEELRAMAEAYAKRFYNYNRNDMKTYCFFNVSYTIPELMRGCSFPVELVIGRGNTEFERIQLIKE